MPQLPVNAKVPWWTAEREKMVVVWACVRDTMTEPPHCFQFSDWSRSDPYSVSLRFLASGYLSLRDYVKTQGPGRKPEENRKVTRKQFP